jgi:hypothetical protein
MSQPYTFQPKTRREAKELAQKTQKANPKKKLLNSNTLIGLIAVASITIIGLTIYNGYLLFVSEEENSKPLTLTDLTSEEQSLNGANNNFIYVYDEETGEFLPEPTESEEQNTTTSPESFETLTTNFDSTFTNIEPTGLHNIYRATPKEPPGILLNTLSRVLNVKGAIHYRDSATSPEIWFGSATDLNSVDQTKPNITIFQNDKTMTYNPNSLIYWTYIGGEYDCELESPTPTTLQQVSNLNAEQRNCYNSLVNSEKIIPVEGNPTQARVKTQQILTTLGYNVDEFEIETSFNNKWVAVQATYKKENYYTPLDFVFYYTDGDYLRAARGVSFQIETMGQYPLVSSNNAVQRLYNPSYRSEISLKETQQFEGILFVSTEGYIPQEGTFSEIIVQYDPNVEITLNTSAPNINGGRIKQRVETTPNTWIVSFNSPLTESRTTALIEEALNNSSIILAQPNENTFNSVPDAKLSPNETITDAQLTIVQIENSQGFTYLTKGYIFANTSKNLLFGTVTALSDENIGVR